MIDKNEMSDRTFGMLRDESAAFRKELASGFKMIGDRFEKMDCRIRKLENWRNAIAGAFTLIVITGAVVLKILKVI